jgi:Arc/MetJ-type ribon-helix-helix transcriptional regulator
MLIIAYVYIVNTMSTEVVTARLPPNDTELIDFFIKNGEFKSKSDFFRFAVKRTLAELIQKQLDSLLLTKNNKKNITKKEVDEIQAEIKKIRKELWSKKYAKSIPGY